MNTPFQSANPIFRCAHAGLLVFALFVSTPAHSGQGLTADMAGPRMENPLELEGVSAYNKAVELYQDRKFASALAEMRNAIRSRELSGRNKGFGFANLCLMYLRLSEWKQAFAACVKAKRLLPGYGPVLTNIRRIKSRERID